MSEIVNIKTSELKINDGNPRVIKDEKYQKLLQSIVDFPEMLQKRPIIAYTDTTDSKFLVIGGNMRLRAAMELGIKKLPVIIADDWSEEQRNEFLIKDNISAGEWDKTMIAADWERETLIDWDLELPQISNFVPNFTPAAFSGEKTGEELLRAEARLNSAFQKVERPKHEVTCPHCAETFLIDKL